MEGTYVDDPFRGSYLDTEADDHLLEDWLPQKKGTKLREIIKQRKVTIISISIAIFIATVVTIAIIIHISSSPCKNNGFYFEEKGIYKCNCNGTSYTGDQCEVAIVEEVMNRDNLKIISEIKT